MEWGQIVEQRHKTRIIFEVYRRQNAWVYVFGEDVVGGLGERLEQQPQRLLYRPCTGEALKRDGMRYANP